MTDKKLFARRTLVTGCLLVFAAVVAAGCATPDGEPTYTRPSESTTGDDLPTTGAACTGSSTDPGGFGQTGSTQPGKTGNGAGDITSDTSCTAQGTPVPHGPDTASS